MAFAKIKPINLSSTAFAFLIIVTSTLTAESLCHAFLHPDLNTLDTNHLVIGTITAVFATFIIMSLFLRTRQLTVELKEKELLKSKEDLEDTLNTMPDFVSVHDKDFKVTKVNNALCEFLNKRPDELIGKQCYQVFHNSTEPYKNCPHQKTSEIDHPVTELINDPNLGVPLQITCSPFFDNKGSFYGSLHIARVYEGANKLRKKQHKIFPICASCKSIRNSDNDWLSLEDYFLQRHEFQFTHTFCKECQEKLYPKYSKS